MPNQVPACLSLNNSSSHKYAYLSLSSRPSQKHAYLNHSSRLSQKPFYFKLVHLTHSSRPSTVIVHHYSRLVYLSNLQRPNG